MRRKALDVLHTILFSCHSVTVLFSIHRQGNLGSKSLIKTPQNVGRETGVPDCSLTLYMLSCSHSIDEKTEIQGTEVRIGGVRIGLRVR